LFHAERVTRRHDEANRRLSQLCERVWNWKTVCEHNRGRQLTICWESGHRFTIQAEQAARIMYINALATALSSHGDHQSICLERPSSLWRVSNLLHAWGVVRAQDVERELIINCYKGMFYRCTVHLDNVKIPFYQQMHLLLNI